MQMRWISITQRILDLDHKKNVLRQTLGVDTQQSHCG